MPVARGFMETTVRRPVRSRADSVPFALASTRMEGLDVAPETKRLLDEWAGGKLTNDELIEATKRGLPAQFGPGSGD